MENELSDTTGPETTDNTLNLVAFAGSFREGSFNRAALRAAIDNAPTGVKITEIDIRDVPFYDGDVENAGDPSSVKRLKNAVRASDGLLIFTPEYNGGSSAVAKNAIDWLSRDVDGTGSPLSGKAVAIAAATPGGRGAPEARAHLIHVIGFMTDRLFMETLGIKSVYEKVDEQNRLTDEATVADLTGWLERFRDHVSGPHEDHEAA